MSNISILRIIKNRIGYTRPIIFIILLLLFVLYIIFFKKLLYGVTYLIIFLFYTIYFIILFIKETLKIKYHFKYGIEAVAFVYKNNYTLPFHSSFLVDAYNKIITPWKTEEIKNGVCYRYLINGETYESSSIFNKTNDTLSIKEGSKINVLVNPKNKNEAIIKELYIKM
jgi:energy-coupling factor transporter transmembrane protein EcfT